MFLACGVASTGEVVAVEVGVSGTATLGAAVDDVNFTVEEGEPARHVSS